MTLNRCKFTLLPFLIIVILNLFANGNEVYTESNDDHDDDEDDEENKDNNSESDDYKGCYDDNMNPYLLFSTKASYKTVVPNELDIIHPPVGCTAKMIWMVIRHGARYTVRSDEFYELYKIRDEILFNHDHKKNVNLCEKDVENLRKWFFVMGEEQENYIHENGLEESRELARRFRKKFPELLKPPYVPGQYMMLVTNTTTAKTLESGQVFMETMFPSNPMVRVYPALKDDLLVQIYTPCINAMSKKAVAKMLKGFYNSDTFQKVLKNVKSRLNLRKLTPKNIIMMYKICRFDKAWNYDKISPWCGVFTTADLKALEYFQDYKYYVKSGYGSNELSTKLGCPLVRDLLMRFKDLDNGITETQPDALFYMSHSTTLNTLLVGLGLMKDKVELTPTNYEQQKKRKWRTSYIGPFGANFAAIFYKCDFSNGVMMYLNEKPIIIDGCDGYICSFDTLYDIYKDYIEDKSCDVTQLCEAKYNFMFYFLCIIFGTLSVIVVAFLMFTVLFGRRQSIYKLIELFKPEEKRHIV